MWSSSQCINPSMCRNKKRTQASFLKNLNINYLNIWNGFEDIPAPNIAKNTVQKIKYKEERINPIRAQTLPPFIFLYELSVYKDGFAVYNDLDFADNARAMIPRITPSIP